MRLDYRTRLKKGVILFDGGMATMLYSKGIFFNRCFEEVNLSQPKLVKELHEEYIQAGAEAIETNSFGANRLKLAKYGLEEKTVAINRAAAQLACEVAGDRIFKAGSVGPLGIRLAPLGVLARSQAEAIYQEQLAALLEGGVDLIIFETFTDIEELLFACEVCHRLDRDIPIQAQFTVGQDNLTADGLAPEKAAQLLQAKAEIDVLGINCSIGPAHSLEVLLKIREHVTKPIAVMPNAGLPKEYEGRFFYLSSPEYMAEYAKQFLEAGASVIGGCCGTTPQHIREMGRMIKNFDHGRHSVKVISQPLKAQAKAEIPLAQRSKLGEALARWSWITSIELVPPFGTDLGPTIAKARQLKEAGVNVVNIPDGPRASSRISTMITAIEIQRQAGIEALMHYCCRDRNLIGMQSDLLGAYAVGLANLLIITGDPPKVGGYPEVTGVFDVDSIGLTTLVSRLNKGIDLGGNELPHVTGFVKGVGANPYATALDREIDRVFRKAQAGADFIITQPVFEAASFISFIEKIAPLKLPVIAGIWPLASYRNASFLQNEVPGVVIPPAVIKRMERCQTKEEARLEGVLIARTLIQEIKPYICGVQVSPPFGRIPTALAVIEPNEDNLTRLLNS